jgi:hypothetical protein
MGRKVRINAKSIPWLCEIDRYIRQYDLRGAEIVSAASDVLDGLAYRHEIDGLIRRRLLRIEPTLNGLSETSPCGGSWTVALTDKAASALWQDRKITTSAPQAFR